VNVLDIRKIAWFFRMMSICHFSTFHFSAEFYQTLQTRLGLTRLELDILPISEYTVGGWVARA